MNVASQILSHLAASENLCEIILAPHAPPIERTNSGVKIIINTVLTHQDIREALSTFRSHSTSLGGAPIGKSGVFSFGIQNLGRYKVSFLTQRGTAVVTIRKIPFLVPELAELLANPGILDQLDALMAPRQRGIVLLLGTSALHNSTFAYSLLQRINSRDSRVIYILERDLSYLMRHDKSLVLQTELDSDVDSTEEGIQNACYLQPDIMYLRDIRGASEFQKVLEAAETGVLSLLGETATDETTLLSDISAQIKEYYPTFRRLLRKIIKVKTTEGTKVDVELLDPPAH